MASAEPLRDARHPVAALYVRCRSQPRPCPHRCSRGFAVANPPAVSAARLSWAFEATPSPGTCHGCAVALDGCSLHRLAPPPGRVALGPARKSGQDDRPCPDRPLNPLTGQSSGYGLPSWCWRCFPQPGVGGSSPLRRRTCPPCRQAPSSRGIWTNVLRALSSVTAALVLGNYSSKHAATLAGSDAV